MYIYMYIYIYIYMYIYIYVYIYVYIYIYIYIHVYIYLIQKHPECKKRSGQELEKGQNEKELKSKWAAKAGVVLVLMRIKF